ncbi:glycosyltransferase [Bacillus sp. MRMR6]|uniref:glycosyltransferase family 2 protein n=1 Tax=Bacillus sp. MRMR6 TaxID=1928617 RepID=UPI000950D983|nr:glycosyltransferase [Bacillus sp. MRMR6]OLS33672.1 glycosyltransferase [Bacillus sp. MRMR6]
MQKPLISIIIPTFNRLYHLAELMESLSMQTFQDFEVLIVNDAGESVDSVKFLYPELAITIINMEENLKHVYARNSGLMQAQGELIMLIDDDDLLVPSHIETMINELNGFDMIYSDVEIVNFQQQSNVRVPAERFLFAYELDYEAMRNFSTFVSSGCLYRKEIHETIGLFDPEVHNYWDWDFYLRVADNYRVARVAGAGVLYDFSDSNSNQSKDFSEARRLYLDRLSEKHNLGPLPMKNFFLLLEEPEVMKRKAKSKIMWDGKSFISRLARSAALE